MPNVQLLTFALAMILSLSINAIESTDKLPKTAFKDIIWDDLLPAELDLSALLSPPNPHALGDENSPIEPYNMQGPAFTSVVPELDGEAVRIPGFIVPLEFDDNQTITEFFLVPYFGACTHSPPPPPNQIIFVRHEEGFKLDDIYIPFWISGIINTTQIQNELAASAYSINVQYLEEYTDW